MATGNMAGDGKARSIYLFWLALALPLVWMAFEVLRDRKFELLLVTGDVAGWLLVATLCITPLMLLLGPLPWLKARRRYLGVASCLYAALHLLVWLAHATPKSFVLSFVRPAVLPGWVALAILLVLALISTDAAVARLGTRWKRLQRWAYGAAILTAVHWLMLTDNIRLAILSFAPLVALSLWRLWRGYRRQRRTS